MWRNLKDQIDYTVDEKQIKVNNDRDRVHVYCHEGFSTAMLLQCRRPATLMSDQAILGLHLKRQRITLPVAYV